MHARLIILHLPTPATKLLADCARPSRNQCMQAPRAEPFPRDHLRTQLTDSISNPHPKFWVIRPMVLFSAPSSCTLDHIRDSGAPKNFCKKTVPPTYIFRHAAGPAARGHARSNNTYILQALLNLLPPNRHFRPDRRDS